MIVIWDRNDKFLSRLVKSYNFTLVEGSSCYYLQLFLKRNDHKQCKQYKQSVPTQKIGFLSLPAIFLTTMLAVVTFEALSRFSHSWRYISPKCISNKCGVYWPKLKEILGTLELTQNGRNIFLCVSNIWRLT